MSSKFIIRDMEGTEDTGSTTDQKGMLPSCITLDTLPNEIQQMIYGHALRAERTLVQSRRRQEDLMFGHERLFDTALLTVNKQVYANARVAFFEENTFSITHAGNAIYHPDIRHLDINGQFASAICEDVTLDPSKVALFLALPKLQTLILHTNKLHDHLMTVRVFIGVDPHWTSLTCTGFGVFELEPSAEWIAGVRSATNSPPPRIYLRDSSLAWIVKSLLKAKKLALKHNGPYLQSAMLNSTPIYSKTYGLAWWLRSYEDYRKLSADPAGHSLTGPEVEGVEDFVRTRLLTTRGLQFTNSQLPNDTWLADVVTGKGYSAELLEWASELLGRELWPMGQDTD